MSIFYSSFRVLKYTVCNRMFPCPTTLSLTYAPLFSLHLSSAFSSPACYTSILYRYYSCLFSLGQVVPFGYRCLFISSTASVHTYWGFSFFPSYYCFLFTSARCISSPCSSSSSFFYLILGTLLLSYNGALLFPTT